MSRTAFMWSNSMEDALVPLHDVFYGTLRKYTMFCRYALVLVCDEASVGTHAAPGDTSTPDGGARRTDGRPAACFRFGSAVAAAGLRRGTVKEGPQTRRRFLSRLSLANTVWLNPFKSDQSGRQRNVLWKCQKNALNSCEHTILLFSVLTERTFPIIY